MALSVVADATRNQNGFVGGVATGFLTMGQPSEVSSFFARICDALTSLPGDRLGNEKQVLAAENAARQYDFRSNLLTWRYGAAGYGLLGLPELGLQGATLEQLHDHAAQRFTSGNAILWLSGPPPDGLRLNLPHGTRQPLPSLVPVQLTYPSWFVDNGCGGVAAGAAVPRSYASSIFREVATRRLIKRLRMDQAVSYAPSVFYDPLDSDTAHLILYADSDKGRRAELTTAFGEVFKELGAVDEAEVEAVRKQGLEHLTGSLAPPPAERKMLELQRAAMDWVLGNEYESLEQSADHLLAVTLADVSAFGREVQVKAMLALPGEATVQPWFGEKAPLSQAPVVKGRKTQHVDAPIRGEQLVHGPDGVSIVWPDGSHVTVRYSDLAAALSYQDGGLHLIGSDAAAVMVEPSIWHAGYIVCDAIRTRVPAHLLLPQSPRPAGNIPKQATTAWQRLRARLTKH